VIPIETSVPVAFFRSPPVAGYYRPESWAIDAG
jgi:hypothetical protein